MQAARLPRKLCLAAAAAASLAMPVVAHAGDLRISLHVPWLVPSVLAALFPYPSPLPPSSHHLALSDSVTTIRGGVAIDGRTFVTNGIHYRLYGEPPLRPGSPEEARARSNLQKLLDGGSIRVRTMEAPTGFRIVTLERNG